MSVHFANTPIFLKELVSGNAPVSGAIALYAKTDSKLYYKDDLGTETELGAGTSDTGYLTGYVLKTETGAFLTTGAADGRYVLQSSTGSFITTGQTGQFYPRTNPSGYTATGFVTGISGHLQTQINSLGGTGTTPYDFIASITDEYSDIVAQTGLMSFRIIRPFTLSGVYVFVNNAPVGASIIVDVNKNGSSIFSSRPQIAASNLESRTGANTGVLSTTAFALGDLVTVDSDQVGVTEPGRGLKIGFVGRI